MALSIIVLLLGGLFAGFGVAILAFHRYDLIAAYTPDKGKAYARRAGLIQLAGGVVVAAGGVLGLLGFGDTAAYIGAFAGIALLLFLGHLNDKQAGK